MLSLEARKILSILVETFPKITPGRPETYLGYKEVHDRLNLPFIGHTYGESLEKQGLENLAIWTVEKKLPGITGLIIDKTSYQPGRGYFRIFGKKEDYSWWEFEIQKTKDFNWANVLAKIQAENQEHDSAAIKPSVTEQSFPVVADYLAVFENVLPTATPSHIAMLRAHFDAKNRTITATELARVAGYENFNAANLQYGIFAQRLCDELCFIPPKGNSGKPSPTYVLAIPNKGEKFVDWTWTMRESVASALSEYWKTDSVEAGSYPIYPDDINVHEKFIEGAAAQILINRYERNEKARAACLDYWDAICCICEMDFAETYGIEKRRGIHVHHLLPISHVAEEYVIDPIHDLRPVCPNCHAALHSENPPVTPEAMRKRIRARKVIKPA